MTNLFYLYHSKAQDECQSDPCVNAINCTDLHADYKCFCQSGWAGKNCDEGN